MRPLSSNTNIVEYLMMDSDLESEDEAVIGV